MGYTWGGDGGRTSQDGGRIQITYHKLTSMNIQEAQAAARAGKKITHSSFISSEFITVIDGNLVDEAGYNLNWSVFWGVRKDWTDGWEEIGPADVFRFIPVSPDGFPFSPDEDFATYEEALAAIPKIIHARYSPQGYYSRTIPRMERLTIEEAIAQSSVISYNVTDEEE